MATPKFKIGDRVKLLSKDYKKYNLVPGDVGTVIEDNSLAPFVNWDRPECNYGLHGTAVIDLNLEILK